MGKSGVSSYRQGIMSGFLGSYVHQVDEKGRLSLPASFRRGVTEGPLVVVQVHESALTLYPEETWREVESRLVELLRRRPESRHYVLGITANAVEVVPDKQGRILVPQRLLNAIGLTESALLVGVIDRIEVWDPSRFETAVAERKPEFESFTAQVFS
ncbi:MAG: division/cell wall cluster transcriptional repressor MraZ [Gemmatimonadota bacterium]